MSVCQAFGPQISTGFAWHEGAAMSKGRAGCLVRRNLGPWGVVRAVFGVATSLDVSSPSIGEVFGILMLTDSAWRFSCKKNGMSPTARTVAPTVVTKSCSCSHSHYSHYR